jgi:hypothetical protein
MLTINRGMAIGAVFACGMLAACGGDPIECKDTAHKASVQFDLKSKFEVGKENPEIDAARAQARTKWEGEVKEKFGAEWASWSKTRSRSEPCNSLDGQQKWICQAEAAPCRDRPSK